MPTARKSTTARTPAKPVESPVIVCDSWGSFHVYPATVDFARKLVQDKLAELGDGVGGIAVMKARKALADAPKDLSVPYLVADSLVVRAMKDILDSEIGQESRALYRLATVGPLDKESKLPVTKAIRDELVLWAFDNKFDAKRASAPELERTRPEAALSFMAGTLSRADGHPVKYVYDADVAEADELQLLLHGTWKPTATVENVVNRYLEVLNRYTHRDEKYHLGVMETPAV